MTDTHAPSAPGAWVKLSTDSLRLLRWIAENRCTESAWLTNGKAAKGPPSNWNQHGLYSPTGSIIVSTEAWRAALPFFEPDDTFASIYRLNDDGRSALEAASHG